MKAKDKVITISLPQDAYRSLHKLCFMSGVTVPKFAAALLVKFIQDPEKFVSLMTYKDFGAHAPGADDLSK